MRPLQPHVPVTRRRCWLLALLGLLAARATPALDLGGGWIGDFGVVAGGGLEQGGTHWGLVELTLDHASTRGGRTVLWHVTAQHVYGGGFSERWVGDLQTVSNIDAQTGTRALEAWVEVPVANNASVRGGRYDLNSEFDVVPAAALFLSSSQGIGADLSQSGVAGPSIFPRTAFGLRVDYRSGRHSLVRGAVVDIEATPQADDGDGVPFNSGPLLALEFERAVGETICFKAGAWGFTRNRPPLDANEDREKQYGAYAMIEHRFGDALVAYGRVGFANDDVSRIARYVGGGVVYERGLLPQADDVVGLAVGHARNGAPYRAALRSDGTATTAAETAIELTWRIPLGGHFALQPDLQYVIDPDTDPAIGDALVMMLRLEASL
jgi:porin